MNRDSVMSVYSDARAEYTTQLCVFLVPSYFQFYVELLEKSKQAMVHEPKRALWQFQNYLNEIHDWNMEKVSQEIHTIQVNSGCDYLEDLLTAVFIAHTKVLTAIRLSTNNKKIEINIPKVDHFLFKALCETAKLLWSSTYLFRDGIPGIEKQQNYRNIEGMLHEGILQAVRSLVPVKSILKDFMNHDSVKEEDSDEEPESKVPDQVMLSAPTAMPEPVAVPEPVAEPVAVPEPVSMPVIAPLSVDMPVQNVPPAPSTPVIVLDNKPAVRFGEFNSMFDSENPTNSDMILEPIDTEEIAAPLEQSSGPVLEILEEEGISLDQEMGMETLDNLDAPSEAIGADDYEEL